MKAVLLAIATLISYSLGGAPYSHYALDPGFFTLSEATPQQSGEVSPQVKSLIEKLTSSVASERAEAACRLGDLKATAAIPGLIKVLADDTEVDQPTCGDKSRWREAAITTKTTPGETDAVALSRMGRPAVEPLIAAL